MSQDPNDRPLPERDAPAYGDTAHDDPEAASGEGERISKRMSRAGVCSRRDAERWIAEGRVAVNGRILNSPAFNVQAGDVITVDGQPIPDAEPTRVWRYHKPDGLVTTARDELGRPTVFDKLPPDLPRVISVGRLDLTSEGLMLLTNDGTLARHLELPATGWVRRYRVRVHGEPSPADLERLARGIYVDGVEYGPIEAVVDRVVGSNSWLTVALKEGKNREVRKVLEHLGLPVSRLIRVAYGPFQLGKLERGAVEEVPRRVLRDQIPGFFPKEERRTAAAPAPRGRLRFDELPKSRHADASERGASGSKFDKGAQRDAGGGTGRRPSANRARNVLERTLGTDRHTAEDRPKRRPRPEERAERRERSGGPGRPDREAPTARPGRQDPFQDRSMRGDRPNRAERLPHGGTGASGSGIVARSTRPGSRPGLRSEPRGAGGFDRAERPFRETAPGGRPERRHSEKDPGARGFGARGTERNGGGRGPGGRESRPGGSGPKGPGHRGPGGKGADRRR